MRWLGTWGAAGLLNLALVCGAFAQAAEDDRRDEEARGLFIAGKVAFEEGRYDDALEYFRRAHELSGHPELLYNVGQSLDRLRRDREAVEALRRFLEEVPDTPHRRQVEARIRALESAIERREPGEDPGEPPPVPTPEQAARDGGSEPRPAADPMVDAGEDDPGIHTRWWFWTGIGAVVVASVVVGVLVANRGGTAAPFEGPDGVHAVLEAAP
ncbi:MAG: tetratricopeptide repeat protein [Myxococcota bacterium]